MTQDIATRTEHGQSSAAHNVVLRALLDQDTVGCLVVGRDGCVGTEYSPSCERLIGKPIREGDDLAAVLGLSGSGAEPMLRAAIDRAFSDAGSPAAESLPAAVRGLTVAGRRLEISSRVCRQANGAADVLLFTLVDSTAAWQAQSRLAEQAALVGILRHKSAFAAFVADARLRLAEAVDARGDPNCARSAVHAIKGQAASYGLQCLVDEAHRIERQPSIGPDELQSLESALEGFLRLHEPLLGEGILCGTRTVEIGRDELRELRHLLDPIDVASLDSWSQRILLRPVCELLGPIGSFVSHLSETLGREVDFSVTGGDLLVDPDQLQPVIATLPSLLRNAIDHGLEPVEERGYKGPIGALSLRFREESRRFLIEVRDDGRGIDFERLAIRAIERGYVTAEEGMALTASDKVQLVFLNGLSSREAVTDLSGRGVGLPSVLAVVKSHAGRVLVETAPGTGTCICIELPA